MKSLQTRLFIRLGMMVILMGAMLSPVTATAQERDSLRITPLLFDRRLDPGESVGDQLTITNLSTETKKYFIKVRDIKGMSEQGSPIVATAGEKTGWEMASWVSLGQESVEVAPNQSKQIPFTIRVPNPASPGAHLALVFVSLTPETPEETGLGIGYDVGSILNIRINGDVQEQAMIREFRTDQSIYGNSDPKFIAKVENQGNTVVRPRGPIEITNIFGKKVATLTMNDTAGAVLPNNSRTFEVSWDGNGFALGRYEAVMGLVYGEDEKSTIAANTTFWVLPGKIIGIIIGSFVALLIIVLILIKLIVRRKLSQMGVSANSNRKAQGYVGTVQDMPLRRLVMVSAAAVGLVIILLAILFFMFA